MYTKISMILYQSRLFRSIHCTMSHLLPSMMQMAVCECHSSKPDWVWLLLHYCVATLRCERMWVWYPLTCRLSIHSIGVTWSLPPYLPIQGWLIWWVVKRWVVRLVVTTHPTICPTTRSYLSINWGWLCGGLWKGKLYLEQVVWRVATTCPATHPSTRPTTRLFTTRHLDKHPSTYLVRVMIAYHTLMWPFC